MQLLSYARKHEIQNESLILTDEERVAAQQERDKVFKSKTISKCIEARDFGAFIDANRGELSPFLEEFQGVLDSAVSFVSALEDAFVHSFDGENELLYCIFVNRYDWECLECPWLTVPFLTICVSDVPSEGPPSASMLYFAVSSAGRTISAFSM